jgi:membrane fusion protein, multidrug efflux system
MTKKSRGIVAGVGIFLVLAFLVLRRYDFFDTSDSSTPAATTASGPARSNVLPVRAMITKQERFSNDIRVTGSILPNEFVDLRSEVSGRITGIFFEEGQKVKKGQKLITINDEELAAQLEKARYTKKLVEETEFRQKRLLEREAISREEYDIARTELSTATADIKLLEAQLEKMTISAPFDGTIGLRFISLGSYITPNDLIASLYNVNPVKLEFSIPARYAPRVQEGMTVSFRLEGFEQDFKGSVYAIEPQIDVSTRSLKMRAIAKNDQNYLRPGQFINVVLTLSSKDDAILVPSQSVVPELQGHKVFVVNNGKAASRKVTLGVRTETSVEIIGGLNPGDTVITSGILQLRDGTAISPNIQSMDL